MDIAVKNSRKTSRSGGSEDDAQPSKRRKQKDVVQLTTNSSSPLRFIDWLNENRECWTRYVSNDNRHLLPFTFSGMMTRL